MPIQFQCPHCDTTLKAAAANAGARARCKKCSEIVTIPAQAARRPVASSSVESSGPKRTSQHTAQRPPTARPSRPAVKSKSSAAAAPSTPAPSTAPATPTVPTPAAETPVFPAAVNPTPAAPADASDPAEPILRVDDPFADLPAFQTLDAPVQKQTSADEEFHQMMMADSGQEEFVPDLPAAALPTTSITDNTAAPAASAPTPAPDLSNIADILQGMEASIESSVKQQQQKNERAVRAKFTVDDIRRAFAKPLGEVQQLSGLRTRQLQAAVAIAAVPIGFVCLVAGASFGLASWFLAWLFSDSVGMLHPAIGLSLIVFAIFILACWIPALNIMFAGLHLLFGRHGDNPSATQLTRESQPIMYEFVDQICEKLGAPKPCRIDLDCNFNAMASLRRGWLLSGRDDLVLTIGIPLIAVQNTEQIASVIAHEFGHFRQGSAMKTYNLIGSLTRWFIATAYSGPFYFYWFGLLTHMLSGTLSREMEWDADRNAVQLAGTQAFTESSARLERYGVAYAITIENLFMLFQSGILVDNIPRFLMHIGRTLPASTVRRIAEQTEQQRLDRFDTHPPTRDRVNAARELNKPGILQLNRPATDLIDHWVPLCKKITLDFYAEKLGIDRKEIDESHVTPLDQLLRDEHKLLLDLAEKP